MDRGWKDEDKPYGKGTEYRDQFPCSPSSKNSFFHSIVEATATFVSDHGSKARLIKPEKALSCS